MTSRSEFVYKLPNIQGGYFGTTTDMYLLPVDTKFSVDNGYWNGEIVSVNGKKYIYVIATGMHIELKSDVDYKMVIRID